MPARHPSAEAAAHAWAIMPYRYFGTCSRCRYDHGEDGRALTVARPAHGREWLCRVCYQRATVRRHALQRGATDRAAPADVPAGAARFQPPAGTPQALPGLEVAE